MAELRDMYLAGKHRRRRSDESVNSGYRRDLYNVSENYNTPLYCLQL
jgi:hypothetical protein